MNNVIPMERQLDALLLVKSKIFISAVIALEAFLFAGLSVVMESSIEKINVMARQLLSAQFNTGAK